MKTTTDPMPPLSFSARPRSRTRTPWSALLLVGCVLVTFAACSSAGQSSPATPVPGADAALDREQEAAMLRHPTLDATLWQQTSVEYDGVTRTSYALATVMMERGLQDSTWTASIEQANMGATSYRVLPPAVVLDVDETVLDNSAYQAWLIENNESFRPETWNAWCRQTAASPVPGALAFTRAAEEQGVQVIYLTNRDASVESATRENLRALGFPFDDDEDVLLTRGEIPAWATSDKESRRRAVAESYRMLLLIGDNFGDFTSGEGASVEDREEQAATYEAYWGTKWIVLPNPQYGSWMSALYPPDAPDDPRSRLRQKHDALRPAASP